ncbi:YheT family hydrolase [Flexithrix dorotheae]|uniref:YheT family hydrolase n=1 Tax=Flexithrix dorotheae TaxID=70993 RepID=UPI0003A5959C|nr:alpha/beta fold hydrolase [Flexithrix dorotheae]
MIKFYTIDHLLIFFPYKPMPIIKAQKFKSPSFQFNGHLQTIIPSFLREIEEVNYTRERIETPDGDFLDIDWSAKGNRKAVLVSHGLEGSANRHYVKGVIRLFNQNGWDGIGWNCRSCSGEMNRLPRFYHHADTPDLSLVIHHILDKKNYNELVLVGFSMGGSLTLKYFGERGEKVRPEIKKGIAVSVPCDLTDCSIELEKKSKIFYNKRFFKKLSEKVKAKAELMPELISVEPLEKYKIKSLRKFDQNYTAPLHGFKSAEDFYDKASSIHHLSGIRKPVLLINALNDPFLVDKCYPEDLAKKSDFLNLELPQNGGHVGFELKGKKETYTELRALEFAEY